MKKTKLFLAILFLLSDIFIYGQEDKALIKELLENDRSSIEALVLYPEATRNAILEASLYPDALIKLESMQAKTSERFQQILEKYPRTTQETIWDLTRYPGLIEQLGERRKGDRQGFQEVLEEYPEKIRADALDMAMSEHGLFQQITQLYAGANEAFDQLLKDYPPKATEAFNELIEVPEVLSILTENIRLTIIVGNLYKNDPEWVRQKADSMSLAVARQQAEDLADWQESIENNPQAKEELIESAEMFAEEYGYDDMSYDFEQEADDVYYDEGEEAVVVEHYYYYSYPYWYGYPSWYVYPRWRPYPYWYEWGFYLRPGGRIVVFGFPSYFFTSWYFYHPYHHYYFPYLSDHFVGYYYGHRHSSSSITVSVNRWRNRNVEVVRDEWLANPDKRVERLREFGRLEKERIEYNKDNPQRALSQKEYLEQNQNRYDRLRDISVDQDREVKKRDQMDQTQPKERVERQQPKERIIIKPSQRERTTEPYRRNPRKVEEGKELHEHRWNPPSRTPRTYPQKQNKRVEPQRRTVPSRSTTPTKRKTTPTKRGGGK